VAFITTYEYEKLLNEYGGKVYSFCLGVTKNKQDADDIYQEACISAYKIVDKINVNENPTAYLCGIVLNVYRSHARKMARRSEIYDNKVVPLFSQEQSESFESDVEGKIVQEEVKKAIAHLDDIHRIPIILFYSQEMGIEKIAEIMSLPVGTIKSRLNTARGKIKQYLEGEGYETY